MSPSQSSGAGAGPPILLDVVAELVAAQNAHDEARMRGILHKEFVYEEVGSERRANGVEQFLAMWAEWRRVFPDVNGTIEQGFTSGDRVVVETSWSGTFEGDLNTGERVIRANGRRMEHLLAAFVCTGEAGKLTQMSIYFDRKSMLRQLGVE